MSLMGLIFDRDNSSRGSRHVGYTPNRRQASASQRNDVMCR